MKLKELFKDKSSWIQGKYYSHTGQISPDYEGQRDQSCEKYCLVGGLERCYPNVSSRYKVIGQINKELNISPFSVMSLENWNDSTSRTFSDIKRLVEELDI